MCSAPPLPLLAPPPQGSCISCLQLVLSCLLAVTQALSLTSSSEPTALGQPCLGLALLPEEWPEWP